MHDLPRMQGIRRALSAQALAGNGAWRDQLTTDVTNRGLHSRTNTAKLRKVTKGGPHHASRLLRRALPGMVRSDRGRTPAPDSGGGDERPRPAGAHGPPEALPPLSRSGRHD